MLVKHLRPYTEDVAWFLSLRGGLPRIFEDPGGGSVSDRAEVRGRIVIDVSGGRGEHEF